MQILQDIDIFGATNADGSLVEHLESDAINSALICWLTSKKGDYIKNPTEGGILDSFNFKLLTDENISSLHFRLKNSIINFFSPSIKLIAIDLKPYYEERYLEITIKYSENITKSTNEVTLYVDAPTNIKSRQYEDVPYIEDNLKNFVLLKKPDMSKTKLVYNTEENSWIWGTYKFINFNQEASNFEEILYLCNLT